MVQTATRNLEPFWNGEPVNSKSIFWDFNWTAISIEIELIQQLIAEMNSPVQT